MKTNFKNFQKSLKIYKKRRHYSMKENEKDILSKLQNHKEERLEIFDKTGATEEEIFLNDLRKILEKDLRGSDNK